MTKHRWSAGKSWKTTLSKKDVAEKKGHWEEEKSFITAIKNIKERIEKTKLEADEVDRRRGDLGKVAELRYGTVVALERELEQKNKELSELQKSREDAD